MYHVNTENLAINKLYICKDYHIQPSEIMMLPYYEYELILEQIKIIVKEQEEQNESFNKQRNLMNPKSMMGNINNGMKNISMPKISIPKF